MDVTSQIMMLALVKTIIGIAVSGVVIVVLASLAFPSTRAALARFFGGHRHDDPGHEAVLTQLASVNAQLASLRGEVYALRCEVAAAPTLRREMAPVSLPPSGTA